MSDHDGGAPFEGWLRAARDQPVPPARAEARRLARAMRDVIERLVATDAPAEVLASTADRVEEAAEALGSWSLAVSPPPADDNSRGLDAGGHPTFFEQSPLRGQSNPLAPPLELTAEDGRVVGTARFGSAYEGPPGCVHGGFIAAAFDEVLGMAQSLGGNPGMTGTLTIRYRRPTPLHADIRFEARVDRVEGRKIFATGELRHGTEVTAEAEAVFITVDFSQIAARAAEMRGSTDD